MTSPLYSRCILELEPGRLVSSCLVTRTITGTHISNRVVFAARFYVLHNNSNSTTHKVAVSIYSIHHV